MVIEKKKMTGITKTSGVRLHRELGLSSAVCLIVNVMIGSGIFISAGNVLQNTGSVSMCLVIWVSCGLLSLLGALSYAELSGVVNKSGGNFSFYCAAFNDIHSFWGPLPSFVYSWTTIFYSRPAEVVIGTLTFAEYSVRPISLWLSLLPDTEAMLIKTISVLAICAITLINYISVKFFVKTQFAVTVSKIGVCIIIIGNGLYQLYLGNTKTLSTGFEGTSMTISQFPIVLYSGLWAFDGWAASTMAVEEIKNPQRNILLSYILAVPFVTIIYVLMNISYFTVMSKSDMVSSPAVAVDFGTYALGRFEFIIPLGVAISTFGSALATQFGTTRLCYAASREGQMLEVFSYISVKRLTPTPAVLLQGVLALVFCLACENIITLIEFASFLVWMFYGLSMVSLLVMRYTMKDVSRPFKIPIVVPIFVLAMSVLLCLTPIITSPKPQFLIALAFIFSAVLIYIPFVYYKRQYACVDSFTDMLKNCLGVEPPADEESYTMDTMKEDNRESPQLS
ncbi:Amino acid/polyamine transporter I [Cinara cedri]|uniref:b(0,+)-type amino acid transporter 1 n=1 Tax=Cinara cedri TaxID=506608 RepID=A0A5E4N8U1_9HEMI|nr:Amino acid/polyamine transporter I [Cinara cedri]